MTNIKSMDRIRNNWVSSTQAKQGEYEEGIKNPRRPWAEATMAAESNYKAGITKAVSEGRFGKGVQKAGNSKWQDGALKKGPARWAQGVAVSADAYESGFAPYAETIRSLTLPKRGPKGDPANIQRVATIADALHKKKLSGGM